MHFLRLLCGGLVFSAVFMVAMEKKQFVLEVINRSQEIIYFKHREYQSSFRGEVPIERGIRLFHLGTNVIATLRGERLFDSYCLDFKQSDNEKIEVYGCFSKDQKFGEEVDIDAVEQPTYIFRPSQRLRILLAENCVTYEAIEHKS